MLNIIRYPDQKGIFVTSNIDNKCPACGYALSAMATSCEACGTEITSKSPNRTVSAIVERFNEIELQLTREGYTGKKLESELILRKARVIRDIPVPNNREDLLSLIHYIKPRIEGSLKPDPNVEDWRIKFAEVVSLSKTAFKNDSKARSEIENLERSAKVTVSSELKNRAKRSPIMVVIVGIVFFVTIVGLIVIQLDRREIEQCKARYAKNSVTENARLESIMKRATIELNQRMFTEALTTASGLRWRLRPECAKESADEMAAKWEQDQQKLERLIQEYELQAKNEIQAKEQKLQSEIAKAEAKKAADRARAESKAATSARKDYMDNEF